MLFSGAPPDGRSSGLGGFSFQEPNTGIIGTLGVSRPLTEDFVRPSGSRSTRFHPYQPRSPQALSRHGPLRGPCSPSAVAAPFRRRALHLSSTLCADFSEPGDKWRPLRVLQSRSTDQSPSPAIPVAETQIVPRGRFSGAECPRKLGRLSARSALELCTCTAPARTPAGTGDVRSSEGPSLRCQDISLMSRGH